MVESTHGYCGRLESVYWPLWRYGLVAMIVALGAARAFAQCAGGDMVFVPGGSFQMGDTFSEGNSNKLPIHTVYLSPYHIDKYEVTNEQYAAALNWAYAQGGLITVTSGVVHKYGSGTSAYCHTTNSSPNSRIIWNGSTFGVAAGKESHPMLAVSWYGAVAFCNWRSAMEGKPVCYDLSTWTCNFGVAGYRLPTEAEWEKAAGWDPMLERHFRFGEHTDGCGYDCLDGKRANYYVSGDPYETGAHPQTTPVGYYDGTNHGGYQTQNAQSYYGCYDMSGNVWEWCHDWYSDTYYSSSPGSNPTGPATGTYRVKRGGWWISGPIHCRSAHRHGSASPGLQSFASVTGFRCASGTAFDDCAPGTQCGSAEPVSPCQQLRPGSDVPTNTVNLQRLWQWDAGTGRFVDPKDLGLTGVEIDPLRPTYLLTHGWDGDLDGGDCVLSDNFAMSSIGCAIVEATDGTANVLAWDWHEGANPNGECDFPDVFISENAQAILDAAARALSRGPHGALLGLELLGDIGFTVAKILWDARRSGKQAADEGNKLGKALVDILNQRKGSLGTELHLIGKSHGGGVMGRVARILAEQGHPATSLTTLDTPKRGCLGILGCFINSLKYVAPGSMQTPVAVFYYPEIDRFGFGRPIPASYSNLTNLRLNPNHAPPFDIASSLDCRRGLGCLPGPERRLVSKWVKSR